MPTDHALLAALLHRIESALAWGPAARWTAADFEELSKRIATETEVILSATTLKRVWGRVAYHSQPSTTTLDALARFAGYDHWRAFRAKAVVPEETTTSSSRAPQPFPEPAAAAQKSVPSSKQLWIFCLVAFAACLILIWSKGGYEVDAEAVPAINPADYHLSVRPVTTGVPNSVVFTYDASAAPSDSIFLQQSWDNRRRTQIDRNGTTHTSIYYLPGYYRPKLVVEGQVVQERDLLVATDEWVAAVHQPDVPVYLPIEDVHDDGRLRITPAHLAALGIPMQPETPTTILGHAGAIHDLTTDDFVFTTRLRHDFATGSAACQQTRIYVLLKNSAIIIPLSRPGCVAGLELIAGGRTYDGRTTDLSAFGVVGDTEITLRCVGKDGLQTFFVNGKQIYQVEAEEAAREIVGIQYVFAGTGTVSEVTFARGNGEIVWAGI